MKFVLILLTFSSQFGLSQQVLTQPASNSDQPTRATKVVRLRNGIAQKVAELIRPGTFVTVSADNLLNVIVLSGKLDEVTTLERTIHELDVPSEASISYQPKNIELTVNIISGSDNVESMPGGQIPETIMPVVKQLRAIFPYKSYQLLSSMLLRSSENATTSNNGVLKSLTNPGSYSAPNGYVVGYNRSTVSIEGGKAVVHLKDFLFKTTIQTPAAGGNTTQTGPAEVGIRTDIDLREGQKVVAGKADAGNGGLALFVILTARLVD